MNPDEPARDAELRRLRRRVAELEADVARYRAALAGGRVGVWESDPDRGTVAWDPATENLYGLRPGSFVGTRDDFYQRMHPDDRDRVRELVGRALAGDGTYAAEFRIVRPDGATRWHAVAGRVLPTPDAPRRLVGIALDVTDRKEAEGRLVSSVREKAALLQEVHHRVKNNLQVVSSLLHLQAAQLTDPAARAASRSSQNRVRAMALVHEAVYRSGDLGRIDLARHLDGLCAHLARAHRADPDRVRVGVSAEGVELELDRAVPCSLLVNELVSNAFQHAFPDGRRGTVTVAAGPEPDGRVALTVADDGIGLPPGLDFRQAKTLGLQLVATLTEQLGGTVGLDRSAGTAFRITFPAARPRVP
jgi:PAS domain S-box-containing protein